MNALAPGHLIVLFVLVLVLFGPHRLPELARLLGRGLREVRKLSSEFQGQLDVLMKEENPNRPRPAERPLASPPPMLESPAAEAPAEETAAVEPESEPQARVIDNGATIPRQKPTQVDAP